jgi:GT2 family glycosyltransferase
LTTKALSRDVDSREDVTAVKLQVLAVHILNILRIPGRVHRPITSLIYRVTKPVFGDTPHYKKWRDLRNKKAKEAKGAANKTRSKRVSDGLREYLSERYGTDCYRQISELIRILDRFEADPVGYETSFEYQGLCYAIKQTKKSCHRAVDVSVVIPIYNNPIWTLTCLAALFKQETCYNYEVLIGDDASTDSSQEVLGRIGGPVRYFRHEKNLGFLHNCNCVARQARGRYLIILNNDTLPLPGWLDQLIQPFFDIPRVGLTGSKLLNPDGSLQEAGGILWRDGSAWNFGRNRDPRLPEFNYVKEVDYCSGASIAVPTQLWNELGGFDPTFAPAYCEDSDLAFRIRKQGYKVIYQPFSELIHHEGRSHGRDVSSGLKAYQSRNQKKLFKRWSKVLELHSPHGQHVYVARDRSGNTPHVLFVDHYVPQFEHDAGSRTIWLYMRLFKDAGFRVSFWPDNRRRDPIYTDQLQRLGIEVLYSAGSGPDFESWFSQVGPWIDYAFLSRPEVAIKYIDLIRAYSDAKILFYGHDLHWRRVQQEFEVSQENKLLRKIDALRALEQSVCARSDVIFYPSEAECTLVRQEFDRDLGVYQLPAYCYSENDLQSARGNLRLTKGRDLGHLLFVGGFKHRPNADGILWFAEKVFPALASEFHLTIVGSNTPEQILALASDRIAILGQVDDHQLQALYSKVGISIIPLRFGGGVKGKVIEAFANGVPVVSTTVGMQGIDGCREFAFVADEPDEFVEQLRLASTDNRLARKKAHSALDFVQRNYSAEAIRKVLSLEVNEFAEKH